MVIGDIAGVVKRHSIKIRFKPGSYNIRIGIDSPTARSLSAEEQKRT